MLLRTHVTVAAPTRWLVVCLLACDGTSSGSKAEGEAEAEAEAEGESSYVLFPEGDCETSTIGVQLFEKPHPDFPTVNAGECFLMLQAKAIDALRVRCVDPLGAQAPSEWVEGAKSKTELDTSACSKLLN